MVAADNSAANPEEGVILVIPFPTVPITLKPIVKRPIIIPMDPNNNIQEVIEV
jgi:hypothetical protein